MKSVQNIFESATTEAEEIYAPEAKMVEASHFQCEGASSNLVGSAGNWFKDNNVTVIGRHQSRLRRLY